MSDEIKLELLETELKIDTNTRMIIDMYKGILARSDEVILELFTEEPKLFRDALSSLMYMLESYRKWHVDFVESEAKLQDTINTLKSQNKGT